MSWTPRTLREILAASVAARGEADAVVTEHARLSWRALEAEAWRVAKALHALGLARGDHVGVLMGNDEKWLATFYGAALIGAVTVPVNTRFKAAELAFCLKQADCKALVLADRFMKID
ncbi:MAG: AMP-binding protein, partial [Bacteroidota bacterium]